MPSIWEELKRRNVVKVAVAYAIVGIGFVGVRKSFAFTRLEEIN